MMPPETDKAEGLTIIAAVLYVALAQFVAAVAAGVLVLSIWTLC